MTGLANIIGTLASELIEADFDNFRDEDRPDPLWSARTSLFDFRLIKVTNDGCRTRYDVDTDRVREALPVLTNPKLQDRPFVIDPRLEGTILTLDPDAPVIDGTEHDSDDVPAEIKDVRGLMAYARAEGFGEVHMYVGPSTRGQPPKGCYTWRGELWRIVPVVPGSARRLFAVGFKPQGSSAVSVTDCFRDHVEVGGLPPSEAYKAVADQTGRKPGRVKQMVKHTYRLQRAAALWHHARQHKGIEEPEDVRDYVIATLERPLTDDDFNRAAELIRSKDPIYLGFYADLVANSGSF